MNDVATDDRVLQIERLIAAPPERLFALWTEPELFAKWFGPEGFEVPVSDLDLRPGGRWSATMRSPEGRQMTVGGVYRRIEPPRRLVFTWTWNADSGMAAVETEVDVRFDPAPGGTRLVLRHENFDTRENRDGHNRGWTSTLAKLERAAA
jgi:uncharacterized protein YndB with AHSA1/START domain